MNLEDQICLNETLLEIKEILEELDEKYSEIMVFRYFADLKFREIAEVLGKTEEAVRMMHHRGLKYVKNRYEKRQKKSS